jgi:hypothetical protein
VPVIGRWWRYWACSGFDVGVSLRDVQTATRHADPHTTLRYDRSRQTSTGTPTSIRQRVLIPW